MPVRLRIDRRVEKAISRMSQLERERAQRAFTQFQTDPRYPGLNLEKLQGHLNLWSFRINRSVRVLLRPVPGAADETWELLDIGPHDIYRRL